MFIRKLTAHEHNADGEDFLCICIGTHIAKTNTGEAAEREVERGDIGARHGGTTHGTVDVRCFQTLSQLLKPAWWMRSEDGWIRLTEKNVFIFCYASVDDFLL